MKKCLSALSLVLLSSSAHADIVSTVNLTQIAAPSVTVQADWIPINGLPPQLIFAEKQNVTLAAPLSVDTGAAIAAGTVVDSFFVALGTHDFTLYPFGLAQTNASATFDGAVLGIIYQSSIAFQASSNFAASDFLGAPNTTYKETSCPTLGFGCAFETSIIPGYTDTATISGNTALFFSQFFYPGDVARVIVAQPAPVPGPLAGSGLIGLLTLLGSWLLTRKR